MPLNGSGTFTRLYSFVQDKINNIFILSGRFDAELDGMASGISSMIARDGQSTTLARVPFAHGIGVSSGDAGTPAVASTADADTGFYFPIPNAAAISAGGGEVARFYDDGGTKRVTLPASTKVGGEDVITTGTMPANLAKTGQANSFGTFDQTSFAFNAFYTGNTDGGFLRVGLNLNTHWFVVRSSNNRLNFTLYAGATYYPAFSIGPGGDITTSQFGDLNTHIEARAEARALFHRGVAYNDAVAWAASNCIHALRVIHSGDDFGNSAGDNVDPPTYGSFISKLYGLGGGNPYSIYAEFRRIQARTWNSGWFDF